MSGRAPEARVRWPVVQQSWRWVAFLHWRVDPASVAPLLPGDLEPDVVDGSAWLALTPFRVERHRVLGLPPVPFVSSFCETNLRTYVRHRDGRDGLWFLSLDVSSVANLAGRVIGAPYFLSAMSVDPGTSEDGDVVRYRCRRLLGRGGHDIVVRPGRPLEPDDVVARLTGRWRAYTRRAGVTLVTAVEHEPWPLRAAEVLALDEQILTGAGVPLPPSPPLVHASDGVDARIAAPRPACRSVE